MFDFLVNINFLNEKNKQYEGTSYYCKESHLEEIILIGLQLWGSNSFEVKIDGHRYFIPSIKKSYHLIPFIKIIIAQ